MEATTRGPDVLEEAVEVAKARLEIGGDLIPMLITDRWGDRGIERFDPDRLADAKEQFAEFVRSSSGDETCALVYSRHHGGEEAILIERGGAGYGPTSTFVQRFRPRRGRFRGFRLIGKPQPVDSAP